MQLSLLSSTPSATPTVSSSEQAELSPADDSGDPGVEPSRLSDLEGLLAGAGYLVRRGEAARISTIIPAAAGKTDWRVEELLATFAAMRLVGEAVTTVGGLTGVRSAFTPLLTPLAQAWTRGAVKAPPAEFVLDGAKLRLWAVAAGHSEGPSYQFGLAEHDKTLWRRHELSLRDLGFSPTLVGHRAGGPALRITGRRRLLQLAQLLGSPPQGADWPRP